VTVLEVCGRDLRYEFADSYIMRLHGSVAPMAFCQRRFSRRVRSSGNNISVLRASKFASRTLPVASEAMSGRSAAELRSAAAPFSASSVQL